jgi:hypothetical protein
MKRIVGIYGINAVAFLSNLAAIYVFLRLSGPEGYGTYGIYIVFLAAYYLWDISVVKSALLINQEGRRNNAEEPHIRAVMFLRASIVPVLLGSLILVAFGNNIYPVDARSLVGGTFIGLIVAGEHILGYRVNRLIYHLTVDSKFQTIYNLRLGATLLRHTCSWGVLLVTGSFQWAIAAILIKGLILGVVAECWIRRSFALAMPAGFRISQAQLVMVCSFFGAAFAVVVMQELPSLYIDRVHGRESLGIYRSFYDVLSAVWFVATVYPTILFAALLRYIGSLETQSGGLFVTYWSKRLSLFHLVYFLAVCAGLTTGNILSGGALAIMPYLVGVAGGVSILGYSRYLIEVAQARHLGRQIFVATLASALVVALILWCAPRNAGLIVIAWAWLIGQTFFFAFVKTVLVAAKTQLANEQFDTAILVLPVVSISAIHSYVSEGLFLALCALGGLIGAAILIALLFRRFNPDGRPSYAL